MTAAPRLANLPPEDLAAAAARLLAEREARYPAAVEAGKLTAAQAEHGIAVMRAVVAEWRWEMDRYAPVPEWTWGHGYFGVEEYVLAGELADIAARARAQADAHPNDVVRLDTAELCEALAWWQQVVDHESRIFRYGWINRLPWPAPSRPIEHRAAA